MELKKCMPLTEKMHTLSTLNIYYSFMGGVRMGLCVSEKGFHCWLGPSLNPPAAEWRMKKTKSLTSPPNNALPLFFISLYS